MQGASEDPMTMRRAGLPVLAIATFAAAGCSLATSVQRNTEAINASSATIDTNTKAVADSTRATGSLVPALQGVERLRCPMESVAALDPTLRAVAALNEPMGRVANLETPMKALGGLQDPMTRLVAIGPSLDATAALGRPMTRVAEMRGSLDAVASLQPSLDTV